MTRLYIAVTVIIVVGLISCHWHKHTSVYNINSIVGLWKLNDETQVNYPTLEFKSDSTAIFTSRGDTLYRWRYLLQADSLILFDVFDARKVTRVDYLDSEKLIFQDLLEQKGKQLYFKSK